MAKGVVEETEKGAAAVDGSARTQLVSSASLGAMATIAAAGEPEASGVREHAPAVVEQGAVVGRYVILSQLGEGGMGVVYAGFDPELDRKVALKLVSPGAGGSRPDSEAHKRLVREAQALARLSHPNVVSVHDVGTVGERVWIAMEFVEGRTLGDWVKAQARSWRDVLEIMRHAGEGLAAAHGAGLLHRDFKPDTEPPLAQKAADHPQHASRHLCGGLLGLFRAPSCTRHYA